MQTVLAVLSAEHTTDSFLKDISPKKKGRKILYINQVDVGNTEKRSDATKSSWEKKKKRLSKVKRFSETQSRKVR